MCVWQISLKERFIKFRYFEIYLISFYILLNIFIKKLHIYIYNTVKNVYLITTMDATLDPFDKDCRDCLLLQPTGRPEKI